MVCKLMWLWLYSLPTATEEDGSSGRLINHSRCFPRNKLHSASTLYYGIQIYAGRAHLAEMDRNNLIFTHLAERDRNNFVLHVTALDCSKMGSVMWLWSSWPFHSKYWLNGCSMTWLWMTGIKCLLALDWLGQTPLLQHTYQRVR